MAPLKPRLTLQKDISLAGRRLAIESSGPFEDLIATLFVGATGSVSWYYVWVPGHTTAADYSVVHNQSPNWNIFGKETHSFTNLYYPDGVTVDRIAPTDNRHELVIITQKDDVF